MLGEAFFEKAKDSFFPEVGLSGYLIKLMTSLL